MALKNKLMGNDDAYHRIFGYDVNEDLKSATLRVKIYANAQSRKDGNLDFQEMRKEYKINKKTISLIANIEAISVISKNKAVEKEIDIMCNDYNKRQKKAKMPTLKSKDEIKRYRTNCMNNILAQKKKDLTEIILNKYIDAFSGRDATAKHPKAIGYEYLKKLPEFANSSNV